MKQKNSVITGYSENSGRVAVTEYYLQGVLEELEKLGSTNSALKRNTKRYIDNALTKPVIQTKRKIIQE